MRASSIGQNCSRDLQGKKEGKVLRCSVLERGFRVLQMARDAFTRHRNLLRFCVKRAAGQQAAAAVSTLQAQAATAEGGSPLTLKFQRLSLQLQISQDS